MPLASDIMCRDVVTLNPTSTLAEAIDLLVNRKISGAPVVDQDGQLVGVITEFALLDVLFEPELKEAFVADYMTEDLHTVAEEDSLTRVIHLFALYRVRRLPVVREGRITGIISRRDVLRSAGDLEEPLAEPLADLIAHLGAAGPAAGAAIEAGVPAS